jgi:hypothetical protein
MYATGLLLVGVLVLLALTQREHLSFDATYKDISRMNDQVELDRIYALAPESLRSLATNSPARNPLETGEKAKNLVGLLMTGFQREVYRPATAPITEAVITSYVTQVNQRLSQRTSDDPMFSFFKTAFSSGDAKRLYMAYMNLTPDASIPPVNPLPTSSTSAVSIPNLLANMRDNLLEYKMTGDARYKTAYEGTKSWMDQYISTLNLKLTRESDAITDEVTRYRTANAEMTKTQADFQRVKTEGPKVENTYFTIKKQMDQIPVFDGSTDAYIKVGIAGGLAIVAGVLLFT